MASMNDLQGQPGEIRMVIQIQRAATGKTETLELVGKIDPQDKENSDGGDALDRSA